MKSTYSVTMLESEIRKLEKILPGLKSEQENVDMVSLNPIESKSKCRLNTVCVPIVFKSCRIFCVLSLFS